MNTGDRIRNILKLGLSATGAQGVVLLTMPLLTRLYDPANFGLLATFSAVVALVGSFGSLRYEIAIAIPEREEDALKLMWLCFYLIFLWCAVSGLAIFCFGEQICQWWGVGELKGYLWLAPVFILCTGGLDILNFVSVRSEDYSLLAKNKLIQSVTGSVGSLAMYSLGGIGLLMGQGLNQVIGLTLLARHYFVKIFSSFNKHGSAKSSWDMLIRYKKFGLFTMPAGVVNSIGTHIPTLLFVSEYGASDTGELSVAMRLLVIPATLIGNSVSQVFLGSAAKLAREGRLLKSLKKASMVLILVSVLSGLVLGAGVAPIVPVIFGNEWALTKEIVVLLIPLYIGQMMVSPLSTGFVACGRNEIGFIAQIVLAITRVTPLYMCTAFFETSFMTGVLVYSLSCLLGYGLYRQLLFASAGKTISASIM